MMLLGMLWSRSTFYLFLIITTLRIPSQITGQTLTCAQYSSPENTAARCLYNEGDTAYLVAEISGARSLIYTEKGAYSEAEPAASTTRAASPLTDYSPVIADLTDDWATIPVEIKDDCEVEPEEVFYAYLQTAAEPAAPPEDYAQMVIVDDDSEFYLQNKHYDVDEDAGTVTFMVCRNGLEPAAEVAYSTCDMTAISTTPEDFVSATSTNIDFLSGETCVGAEITINTDTEDEGDEVFGINIKFDGSSASGCTGKLIEPSKAFVTIHNVAPESEPEPVVPTYSFEFGDYSVNEPETGTSQIRLTINKGVDTSAETNVEVNTREVSATTDTDYQSLQAVMVTFSPTTASMDVAITIESDKTREDPETFEVSISNPSDGIVVDPSKALVTIHDSASQGSCVSFEGSIYTVKESGTVAICLHREGNVEAMGQIAAYTEEIDAIEGVDFIPIPAADRTLTFEADETRVCIDIETPEDLLKEDTEYFKVSLTELTGSNAIPPCSAESAQVLIVDNDGSCVSFGSSIYTVKESGTATICLHREGNVDEVGQIVADTEEIDATEGFDYIPISAAERTMTFQAAETRVCIDIETQQDWLKEDTEYFQVSLTELTGSYAIPPCSEESAQVLIADDDDDFCLEGTSHKVKESDELLEIVIIRRGELGKTSSVCVSTQSGDDPRIDAQENRDYTRINNVPIPFDVNEKSQTLQISITKDNVGELEENFSVMLETCLSNTNVHEEQIGFPRKTTVSIINTFTCTEACVNGECTAENTCGCDVGYSGPVCTIPLCDVCEYGDCIAVNSCQCTTGWDGPGCDIPVCTSSCSGNGDCVGVNDCKCFDGWMGDMCSMQVTTTTLTTTIEEYPVGTLLTFSSELNDATSELYQQYQAQFEAIFSDLYTGIIPNFVAVHIVGFEQGSVRVIQEIITESNSGVSTADITEMVSQLVDDNDVLMGTSVKLSATDPLTSPTLRCPENYCLNGGQCIETETSYYCFCLQGFSGDQCLTQVQPQQEDEHDPATSADEGGLSDGAVAAIILGAFAGITVLILIGVVAFWVLFKRQPKPQGAPPMDLLPYTGPNPAYGIQNGVTDVPAPLF